MHECLRIRSLWYKMRCAQILKLDIMRVCFSWDNHSISSARTCHASRGDLQRCCVRTIADGGSVQTTWSDISGISSHQLRWNVHHASACNAICLVLFGTGMHMQCTNVEHKCRLAYMCTAVEARIHLHCSTGSHTSRTAVHGHVFSWFGVFVRNYCRCGAQHVRDDV